MSCSQALSHRGKKALAKEWLVPKANVTLRDTVYVAATAFLGSARNSRLILSQLGSFGCAVAIGQQSLFLWLWQPLFNCVGCLIG
jgi:hypothetical protein